MGVPPVGASTPGVGTAGAVVGVGFVGGGFEMQHKAWSGRAAIIHRSSHLGDEFIEMTGAERIEFGSEQLDLLAAYDVAGIARVYGGGSWIFRSYLGWEPQLVALGVKLDGIRELTR